MVIISYNSHIMYIVSFGPHNIVKKLIKNIINNFLNRFVFLNAKLISADL